MNQSAKWIACLLLWTLVATPLLAASARPASAASAVTPAAAAPTQAFAARFVQTRTLPGFDQPLVSHGLMRFGADHSLRWEITQPYHYLFEIDHGQAFEQLPDGTRRQLDPARTPWLKAVEHIFISALSGDRSRLAQYFEIAVKPLPGDGGREVTLTPKSDALGGVIERIEVTDTAPGQPRHLVIVEASGGRMDLRFTPLPAEAGP